MTAPSSTRDVCEHEGQEENRETGFTVSASNIRAHNNPPPLPLRLGFVVCPIGRAIILGIEARITVVAALNDVPGTAG